MATDDKLLSERSYLRVQPGDAPLRPESVVRSIAALHRNGRHGTPTYEFLFAATGTTGDTGDRRLAWYVGVDGEDPDGTRLARLERTLRGCLPDAYDLVKTEVTYADALDLPVETDDDPKRQGPTEPTGDPDGQPATDGSDVPVPAPTEPSAADAAEPPLADWSVAGLEWQGVGDRPDDWQYPLEPLAAFAGPDEDTATWPVARLCAALATSDAPTLVQVLVEPKPDWTVARDARVRALRNGRDLRHKQIGEWVVGGFIRLLGGDPDRSAEDTRHRHTGPAPTRRDASRHDRGRRDRGHHDAGRRDRGRRDHHTPPAPERSAYPEEARRSEPLADAATRQSFTVNARAVAFATDGAAAAAETTLRSLRDVFRPISADHYAIEGRVSPHGSLAATRLLARLLTREMNTEPSPYRHQLPGVPNRSPAIVAGPEALGGFCLTGGAALAEPARRAMAPTRRERAGLALPPRAVLNRYLEADGLTLGYPVTADREPLDTTAALPTNVQQLHTLVAAPSGAGKSALGQRMLADNYAATEGANIYLDSKGDGGPEAYLQSHYDQHGDLQDVYYFDCAELLPALPLLSIEPQLEAGIDRTQAVENITDRYLELVAGYMGREAFHDAPMAVDVIEAMLKAQFDPVHGADSISQLEFVHAVARLHRTGDPPPVSDPHLQARLADISANSPEVFDSILNAALRRITTVTKDARLTPLFTHTGDGGRGDEPADEPWFDFLEHLNEQCVIIIDTSGYHDDPRKLLTLAIIGELWTALERRTSLAPTQAELPQVNLFVEEAADLATFDVLNELLSQGRAFGVGVTVMLQFPAQVRDEDARVYNELIEDINTHVTGPVTDPDALASVYATAAHDADAMATRMANLDRGEWLVRPAASFGADRPKPFVCRSPPLPPGHPDGAAPLSGTDETVYQGLRAGLVERMADRYGLKVGSHAPAADADADADVDADTDADREEATATAAGIVPTVVATVQHTERLPETITYHNEPPYPLECTDCEKRYPSNTEGMHDALTCCHSLAEIDRDDVPITRLELSLKASQLRASDYSPAQLRLLIAIHMAHQQQFDTDLEYDIVHDSMVRLQEYVGADRDDVQRLLDDDLIRQDCSYPHQLYTLTPAGRDVINVSYREGIAHGDGEGDLHESSLHVAFVELGTRFLEQTFLADPDHPAEVVKRYHEVDGGRLDAAALDADGNVVVTLEAERINNDAAEAIPADFDTMAACDPDRAIWVVKNREATHRVLQVLNDPADGQSRVEKTYSENMHPRDFNIDTAGLTDIVTFRSLRNRLEDA